MRGPAGALHFREKTSSPLHVTTISLDLFVYARVQEGCPDDASSVPNPRDVPLHEEGYVVTSRRTGSESTVYAAIFGCYVIFVNRVGNEGPLAFWGESEIIDPFGQVVATASGASEEIIYAEASLGQLREARTVLHTVRDDDLSFLHRRVERIMSR